MNNTQLRSTGFFLVAGGIAIGLSACATTRPTRTHEAQVEHEALVTVTALDVPNRLVTVRNAAGELLTFYVDRSVDTFPQAKVDDQVRVRYTESFAVRLKKPDEADTGLEVSDEVSRSQTGEPSAHAEVEVKATVRIEKVDRKGAVVTFTGPRGRRTVQVLDQSLREYLKKLKEGDNVEVTYREALALALERVPGR